MNAPQDVVGVGGHDTTRGLSMSHIARRILHNIRHLGTTVLHDAKLRENEENSSRLGCLVVD